MTGAILLGALAAACAWSQTTQGILAGQALDKLNGAPLSEATITCRAEGAPPQTQRTDAQGFYIFPLLSPGIYEIRADQEGYQSQVIAEQELPVAGRLEVNFALRPLSDLWSTETDRFSTTKLGRLVHFYATDADKLLPAEVEPAGAVSMNTGTTLSYLIGAAELEGLPLRGRDAYAMLVTLPGVTADNAIGRGLGVSVNGQRPAASNFLLDGLENNNYLVTGNLTTIPPEGLQEYRISTNNFSAEYGRTSGFVANAITRAGGPEWHGFGYFYLKNDALDATGYPTTRLPLKQIEPGFGVSGPLIRGRIFFSTSAEALRLRTYLDPLMIGLPTQGFVTAHRADPVIGNLIASLQAPPGPPGVEAVPASVSPASSLNQYLATPRIDAIVRDAMRLFLRASFSNLDRPDFNWTPYKAFVSPLTQADASVGAGLIETHAAMTEELRAGWGRDNLHLDRADNQIPQLQSPVVLPGSPSPYAYRNRSATWQLVDNVTWTQVRHVPKIGGSLLWRRIDSALSFLPAGFYQFPSIDAFQQNAPSSALVPVTRPVTNAQEASLEAPDFGRQYANFQFSAFAQDSFKVSSRLLLTYGVRYENYGAPVNIGPVKDLLLQLGSGSNFTERLTSAFFAPASSKNQRLFDPDNKDVAGRFGFAWNLGGRRDFVVRGGYGIFYDRPFDNLWENLANNNFVPLLGSFAPFTSTPSPFPYPDSAAQRIASLLTPGKNPPLNSSFPTLTLFQPGFRDGYAHSYFLGVERSLSDAFTVTVSVTGSDGRKLIATDLVDRVNANRVTFPDGRDEGPIDYRSNQGDSDYNALTVTGRYRSSLTLVQVSYSWSHTIDNQSDALGNDFFNLGRTNTLQTGPATGEPALFTAELDSRIDRGSADFDQRHNLVVYSLRTLPSPRSTPAARWLRNWEIGELAAVRSGFPFTVYSQANAASAIPFNRASLNPSLPGVYEHQFANGGGRVLLNANAFETPATGSVGTTGRNGFEGPGFYSIDLSLRRSFRFSETGRLTLRADAFNILNHANLNNPNALQPGINSSFGFASYGRQGVSNFFPASTPLDETGRQIQLSVRVDF